MKLLLAFFVANSAFAYIPEYALIAAHTADQHGRGSFQIEQDVNFRKDGEVFTVRETWLVNGESSLRVSLEGRGPLKGLVQGTLIYQGNQRFFLDPTVAGVRTQRLGDDWLEPLFHFRNPKYLRARLVSLKVAPADSEKDRAPLGAEGEPKYEAPTFLRLSRVGGTTAWAIAQNPAANGTPSLWIEQDQFVIRKYHGADQVVMKADDYSKYDDGLWFPRLRVFTYGSYTVDIQTVAVKSLGKLKPDDARFRSSSLVPARDGVHWPESDALKEFYSRFR